ncbi:MAG: hypothetical protein NDI77_03810 [Geobacteraceae bacterium]|nr:hypothetical protein [Geobacteraceae bacterium]
MDDFIRDIPLPNGLTISFSNQSRRYFGDYYHVKLEILCKVPVTAALFKEADEYAEARALLGDEVVYRRSVEQMGVPSTGIELVLERLMADFEKHSLPYFATPGFPQKLVSAELKKRKGKLQRVPAPCPRP